MARQLTGQGEQVASLTLLDSVAPTAERQQRDAADELAELLVALAAANGVSLQSDTTLLRKLSSDEAAELLIAQGLAIDIEQFSIMHNAFSANLRCYARYRPERLGHAIDTCLYRATQLRSDGVAAAADYGWGALLAQSPVVVDIDADHFSLLEGVPVQRLADALRRSGAVPSGAATERPYYTDLHP